MSNKLSPKRTLIVITNDTHAYNLFPLKKAKKLKAKRFHPTNLPHNFSETRSETRLEGESQSNPPTRPSGRASSTVDCNFVNLCATSDRTININLISGSPRAILIPERSRECRGIYQNTVKPLGGRAGGINHAAARRLMSASLKKSGRRRGRARQAHRASRSPTSRCRSSRRRSWW